MVEHHRAGLGLLSQLPPWDGFRCGIVVSSHAFGAVTGASSEEFMAPQLWSWTWWTNAGYGESWASAIARFVEASCTFLGIPVNQWTPSLFIGTLIGVCAALSLHALDALALWQYRRRLRQRGSTGSGDPLLDELSEGAHAQQGGGGDGVRGGLEDFWTLPEHEEENAFAETTSLLSGTAR